MSLWTSILEFVGRDSGASKTADSVAKSVDNVARSTAQASRSTSAFEQSTANMGRSVGRATTGTAELAGGMGNLESSMAGMASKIQGLQWMFMDFGLVLGGMVLQQTWDMTVGMAMGVEEMQTTLEFMGETKEASKAFMEDTMSYAASASKVSYMEQVGVWKLLKLQTNASAEDMMKYQSVVGDTIAQMKINGRDASATGMALADAISGQWRRMYEIGIKKEDVLATGKWSGEVQDMKGFMEALEQVYDERHVGGIANKVMSAQDRLDMLTEQFQLMMQELGAKAIPVLNVVLDLLLKVAYSPLGPFVALAGVVGMLAIAFIFLAPFIMNAVMLVQMFGTESVIAAGEAGLQTTAVQNLGLRLGLLSFEAETAAFSTEQLALAEAMAGYNAEGAVMGQSILAESMIAESAAADKAAISTSRLGMAMGVLAAVVGGVLIAWTIFNYFQEQSKKLMEEQYKVVSDNEAKLNSTRATYEDLQAQMKAGVTSVYDKETKSWISIEEAVDKAKKKYEEVKDVSAGAYDKMIKDQAAWESVAKGITKGMPIQRDTGLGNIIEGQSGLQSLLFGMPSYSQEQKLRFSQASSVLSEEDYALSAEGKKKFKVAGETDEEYANRQRKITNDFLREKLKLENGDITNLREAKKATKDYEEKVKDLNIALGQLMSAFAALVFAIFGDKNSYTKAMNNAKDPTTDVTTAVGDLAPAISNMASFVLIITGFIRDMTQALVDLTSWLETAKGKVDEFYAAGGGNIPGMPGRTGDGGLFSGVFNMTTPNQGQGILGTTGIHGMNFKNMMQDKGFVEKVNSPLTLYNGPSGFGPPMLRFPQLTPEVLSGLEANRFGGGGKVIPPVIHQHNESYKIDASHMNENQLMGLLTNLLEGVKTPAGMFKRQFTIQSQGEV